MEMVGLAFALCIPLAALIFGAVSIRNQDVRTIMESMRSEIGRLERALGERDLHIMRMDAKYEECERHREDDRKERMALLERLARIEIKVNGGKI